MTHNRRVKIVYVLFAQPWELFLTEQGVSATQVFGPARPVVMRSNEETLAYLRQSLRSFLAHNPERQYDIEVALVELTATNDAMAAAVEALVAGERREGASVQVVRIPRTAIEHLLAVELKCNSGHASPNKIHEFVLFDAMQRCESKYLYVSDIDTLYFGQGFVSWCEDLLTQGNKAVCAFVDRTSGKTHYAPDRMHTVSLFINMERLRSVIDLPREQDAILDFDGRLARLTDRREKNYFLTARRRDTLSFLTSSLRHDFGDDLVVAFNDTSSFYFEDGLLVLGNEYLVHGKYFYQQIREIIARNYAGTGPLEFALQPLLQGLAVAD